MLQILIKWLNFQIKYKKQKKVLYQMQEIKVDLMVNKMNLEKKYHLDVYQIHNVYFSNNF